MQVPSVSCFWFAVHCIYNPHQHNSSMTLLPPFIFCLSPFLKPKPPTRVHIIHHLELPPSPLMCRGRGTAGSHCWADGKLILAVSAFSLHWAFPRHVTLLQPRSTLECKSQGWISGSWIHMQTKNEHRFVYFYFTCCKDFSVIIENRAYFDSVRQALTEVWIRSTAVKAVRMKQHKQTFPQLPQLVICALTNYTVHTCFSTDHFKWTHFIEPSAFLYSPLYTANE